jgi:hypothetical protein
MINIWNPYYLGTNGEKDIKQIIIPINMNIKIVYW